MAKGIPLMGRGPDGKAKIINVDENGNVKVQLSGTNVKLLDKTYSYTELKAHTYICADGNIREQFGSGAEANLFSLKDYKDFVVVIINNTDVEIGNPGGGYNNEVRLGMSGASRLDQVQNTGRNLNIENIPAGAKLIVNNAVLGMLFMTIRLTNGNKATSGSLRVIVGGVK